MKHTTYFLQGTDGKDYEVSEEIFREYKHSVWNEEQQYKRERKARYNKDKQGKEIGDAYFQVVSVDSIIDGGGEHHLGVKPDFTEQVAEVYEEIEMLQILSEAITDFSEEELDLYSRLFVEGISEREYEKQFGVPRKTVSYRKQKMLGRLKNLLKNRMK